MVHIALRGSNIEGSLEELKFGEREHWTDSAETSTPANGNRQYLGELPSVALTQRFLVLCNEHGSQRLAVRLVAVERSNGRNNGVPGFLQEMTGRHGTLQR